MFIFDMLCIAALVFAALFMLRLVFGKGDGTTSFRRARGIMGRNIFTPNDAFFYLGATLPVEARAALKRVPFSVETLKLCKDTHVLVAVLLMSVNRLRARAGFFKRFSNNFWFADFLFANDQGVVGWHLVRKSVLVDSNRRSRDGQLQLLTSRDALPSARVMVYTMLAMSEKQGDRFFEKHFVRCADTDGYDNYVAVGLHYNGTQFVIEIQKHSQLYGDVDLYIAPERVEDRTAA